MRFLIALALVFGCASSVMAHPGKTDRWGGHKCWKECASWELLRGEYHLHDKDFRPVRVKQDQGRNEPLQIPSPESPGERDVAQEETRDTVPQQIKVQPTPGTVVVQRYDYVRTSDEEIFPLSSLLLALAAVFLLLLLLIFRIKKN